MFSEPKRSKKNQNMTTMSSITDGKNKNDGSCEFVDSREQATQQRQLVQRIEGHQKGVSQLLCAPCKAEMVNHMQERSTINDKTKISNNPVQASNPGHRPKNVTSFTLLPVRGKSIQSKIEKGQGIAQMYKGPCYFHHNCPADGYIKNCTKRQCKNGKGYSWKNRRGGCENLRP